MKQRCDLNFISVIVRVRKHIMSMLKIELPYKPFLRQAQFHSSPALYRLFGGAAGPGKTEAIMWEGIIKCLRKPKTAGILFRRTFPELEMSLIRRFLEKCPRELYQYHASQHIAQFVNGSFLQFAYCDSERDVYRYQSAEFDFIGIDELTHFTEYIFTYLLSRLRTVKSGITPSFFAATNPGNIGHGFVKSRWVDKDCKEHGYNPVEYDFIPATLKDNPLLASIDPDYIKRLENLPEQQRKALLLGSFDVFAGQFFTEWDKDKHVVAPFTMPETWRKYRAYDYGYENPACCKWYAIDYDGNVWVYRELYFQKSHNLDAEKQAVRINELSAGETYEYSIADPAIFSPTGMVDKFGGQTIAESFARYGIMFLPGSNRRVDGWNLMHQYLWHSAEKMPRMRYFFTCRDSIRTIPALIHDEKKPDDLDTDGEDHAADVDRYFLTSLHERSSERPKSEVEQKLAEFLKRDVVAPGAFNEFYYGRRG